MYKRALVTGGAGFIGSYLTKSLLKDNLEVIILDNLSVGKTENVPNGAELLIGDVRCKDDVTKALKGVDIVFHEAALVSVRSSIKEFYKDAETNIMGTINLLSCSYGRKLKKIVFASSMAVYADCNLPIPITEDYKQDPISPYGISKLASEKYCLQFSKDHGIDCNVLRYFNTYGAGQTLTPYVGVITIFINRLLSGHPPLIFGDGEQKRDFVHVSDVVSANLKAMKSDVSCGVFNVGTGKSTSVNEIADMLCKEINQDINPGYMERHPGELQNSIADISSIRTRLGYNPECNLADMIKEVIAFYKERKMS